MSAAFLRAAPAGPARVVPAPGFTLLEVMIAILIFAIGILSVVALMAVSTAQAADSRYRSEAAFLANQLVGDIWTNRGALAGYDFGGTGAAPAPLAQWVARVQSTLPGAGGASPRVAVDAVTRTVTITIFWQPPNATAQHRHVVVTRFGP